MSIEVISIGSELLSGRTINTNAARIGELLRASGLALTRVTTLPDDLDTIRSVARAAAARADAVIVTGGLGPTHDDITSEALAPLGRRGEAIPNHLGTAPGIVIDDAIFALPGVPSQMEPMLIESVIPQLERRVTTRLHTAVLYLCCIVEREVELPHHPDVAIGICPSYGTVSLYLSSHSERALAEVREHLLERYASNVYSTSERSLPLAVGSLLRRQGVTIACAESCTGGALTAALTSVAGASDYVVGGLVAYTNGMKERLLGVRSETLKRYGAVSGEAVREMAEGVLERLGVDCAVAISGIAGPSGGSDEKPVGTVWMATGTREVVTVEQIAALNRSRRDIITFTVNTALGRVWQQRTR
jgi:nicotinamide-nucleotide amidase